MSLIYYILHLFIYYDFLFLFFFCQFFRHIYTAVNKRTKKSKNGHLSLAEFILLTKQFPILLLPVKELQNQLKKNTLGIISIISFFINDKSIYYLVFYC